MPIYYHIPIFDQQESETDGTPCCPLQLTGRSSQTDLWLMRVMLPSGMLVIFLARGAMSRNSSVYSCSERLFHPCTSSARYCLPSLVSVRLYHSCTYLRQTDYHITTERPVSTMYLTQGDCINHVTSETCIYHVFSSGDCITHVTSERPVFTMYYAK